MKTMKKAFNTCFGGKGKWEEDYTWDKSNKTIAEATEEKTRKEDKEEIKKLKERIEELEMQLRDKGNEGEQAQQAQHPTGATGEELDVFQTEALQNAIGPGKYESMMSIRTSLDGSMSSQMDGPVGDTYDQRGIFKRPACQKRHIWNKSNRKDWWPFKKSERALTGNSEDMVDQFMKFSRLGKVMKDCKNLMWEKSMYTPLAEMFESASIPRICLPALEKVLADDLSSALQIVKEAPEDMSDLSGWINMKYEFVWANPACYKWWGQTSGDMEGLNAFKNYLQSSNSSYRRYMKAVITSYWEGDLQPKRHVYNYFGSEPGVKKQAIFSISQTTPVLVEIENKIYFGTIVEHNAPQKHEKEIYQIVSRSHSCFKYSRTSVTIFTPCGVILQQNPVANYLFGMDSAETNLFSDFKKDGTPVDRIKALFADNEDLYDDMWETVMVKNENWWKKMKVYKHNLRPMRELNLSISMTSSGSSSFKSARSQSEYGEHSWYMINFNKFADPADGQIVLFCEMRDVTEMVEKEQKLRAARKHEHDLLQSIIPEHIIGHLVDEKKKNKIALENSDSDSDGFLDISALRMINDNRVRDVAEHHEQVTVSFLDIVGFTNISSQSSPGEVMTMLNRLFSIVDELSDRHNIYKVETIGDAYMSVAGLNLKSEKAKLENSGTKLMDCGGTLGCPGYHATRMIAFCKAVLDEAKLVLTPMDSPVEIRVGVHTGDVMTGVVGNKMPRFCLFGDTVNVASRMESTGKTGHIQASDVTRTLVTCEDWVPTGGVEVKGKGTMETFLLEH
mmetsp:Transcript_5633/g.10253  ORF Transcript_5633/g.10253 Transcript_5633/m.10253 type:complete len:788 (+) Transcript_5633:219-2582(+)